MALRPRFNREDTFVVCRRIKLAQDAFLEVGAELSMETHSRRRLRRWYRRRMIAKKGSEWAERVMTGRRGSSVMREPQSQESLHGSSEFPATIEIVPGVEISLGELVAQAHRLSELSPGDWNKLSDEDRSTRIGETLRLYRESHASKIRVEQHGSWFTIYRGDEQLAKLQGQAAVDEWLKENGGDV